MGIYKRHFPPAVLTGGRPTVPVFVVRMGGWLRLWPDALSLSDARPGDARVSPTLGGGGRDTVYSSQACPVCAGSLQRVPRNVLDRVWSWFAPVHRYRCAEMGCDWEGCLRVGRRSPAAETRPRLP